MGITDSGLCYKRMLFKSLIFIALAAAALAQTAPEETFVEEIFNAASTHVENFMQEETEARKSACVKAADASINNVYTEVKTSQKFLNSLPNGRTCASRNQHLIAKARRWIKTSKAGSTPPRGTSSMLAAPASVGTFLSSPFVSVGGNPSSVRSTTVRARSQVLRLPFVAPTATSGT